MSSFTRSVMPSKSTDSRLWKENSNIWPEFYQHVHWTIGKGHIINFWEDQWIKNCPSISAAPGSEVQVPQRQKLIDFIDSSGHWDQFRETNIHLLRDCQKTAAIWNAFLNPNLRALFYILPVKEWISWNLQSKIHRVILHHANYFVQAMSCLDNTPSEISINRAIQWTKPRHDGVKLNTDGAFCSSSHVASCGGLIRDGTGKWLSGFIANLGISNVIGAELWSIFHGLKIAWEKGFKRVDVESDSKLEVNHSLAGTQMIQICILLLMGLEL
ncbi:putative non-LTR retroelement reverse transcriptase [Senna tora]|uniref:Putative non-LTR retroelement reverse transcriptase n=1 Tax=Senna tora TaxID=362788 RepID=A0A834WIV7_9FABA|nr:putative non-LTR retroelement reverse transcriptase [Senna tora]